jgi:dihydrofolate reductase
VRRIVESTLVTLDGVIEDPAAWAGDYIDADFNKAAYERLMDAGAMLMGKHTYALLERDWAGQTGEFADRINGLPKYVFSSTMTSATWSNTTVVKGDVVSEVTRLKQQEGADLAVYGHGRLSQTLLRNGLLDEIQISVFPVIAGKGERLFHEGERARLNLLSSTSLATGVVVLRYAPILTEARQTNMAAVIRRFFELAPLPDSDAFFALFASDAILTDEDKEYRDVVGVRKWRNAVPLVAYAIEGVRQTDGATIATVTISGDFPGSPATGLEFRFELVRERIRGLHIE